MKLSEIIRQALERKGIKSLKSASTVIGISTEIMRLILNKEHIPKDETLKIIAGKLDLDHSELVLTAHRNKVPESMRSFFLSPSSNKFRNRRKKRVYPLSEEQCNYLEEIMNLKEIQIIRKYRQVTEEGQTQIKGYIDFMFQTERMRASTNANIL